MIKKLNAGCGTDILEGYVNLDAAALPGVQVVHDLKNIPWPFKDNEFDEILIKHVLEHLPDTILVMEEIWRLSKPGAHLTIRVPYWNSSDFITDPTHIKAFNEHSLDFFDPSKIHCQNRPYYSKARFQIETVHFFVRIFGRYFPISSPIMKSPLLLLAHFLSNIIQVIEFRLTVLKKA